MEIHRAKELLKQRLGDDFSHFETFFETFQNEVIKPLNFTSDAKLLDLGTGWGIMAIILALNGFNVLTGEPEEDEDAFSHSEDHHHSHEEHDHISFKDYDWRETAAMVEVADKISFQYLNAKHLPFPAASFDAIFMYDTLHHIDNRKLALQECTRVLRPNGVICVIEMNEAGRESCREKWGFKLDQVDPREYLNKDEFGVTRIKGEYVDAFLLKKRT